ncbi:MAG: protein translocase subunit SecD, partial [Gemmatimonadota bacterium]|nr:protein translocase subunit SecD [Gemmatimonadota bacterium]
GIFFPFHPLAAGSPASLMFQNLKIRLALIVALILASGFLLQRNHERQGSIVTLGLDLQGGSHLALEIDETRAALAPEQRADAIDRALRVVRTRVDELGVAEPVIQKAGDDRIIVELAGVQDEGRAKEVIQKTAFLEFQLVRSAAELQAVLPRIDRAIVQALGAEVAAEPAQTTVGGLLRTRTPEADSASLGSPLSSKLAPAGEGEFAADTAQVDEITRYLALPEVQRLLPRGSELLWGFEEEGQPYRRLYLLEEREMMTGENLERAQAQSDPTTLRPTVVFELNRSGGRIFGKATAENVGRQMAIVLDEKVYSAPVINSQITTNGQIEMGGASLEEARDLALVLRAGALPAPLRIVEERTVGPSLGADSVEKGKIAGIIGVVMVILITVGYYRLAGAMAIVALAVYILFVLAGLAALQATLTFPGIAGLILSIGMAVDANVLIFERIREELAAGRTARTAVAEGFQHALSAIVDSNLTTLITAVILFYVGTGAVKGFAVTLSIGIVASMFTAIFVTRTLFMIYLGRRTASQAFSI